MAYKLDKIKLPKGFDDRVKLNDKQREEIKSKYKPYVYSLNMLAEEFGVSKRTIHFIVNPESHRKAREQYKERRKDGRYYNREKNTKAIRRLRAKKKKLFINKNYV